MGTVTDLEQAKTATRKHEDLLRRLRLAADTHPNMTALLREAADYLEVRPPWVGLASSQWVATLTAMVRELEAESAERLAVVRRLSLRVDALEKGCHPLLRCKRSECPICNEVQS
jgi:hypothetical protein